MKRFLSIVFALLIVAGMTGCKKTEDWQKMAKSFGKPQSRMVRITPDLCTLEIMIGTLQTFLK